MYSEIPCSVYNKSRSDWRSKKYQTWEIFMSEKSTSVQIRILDKEYHINCPPSDQEALMKSARYLDESMRKVKDRGNIHGSEKVAVMAALNITYELLQKNRLINESRRVNGEQISLLEDKIDQALQRSRQLEM